MNNKLKVTTPKWLRLSIYFPKTVASFTFSQKVRLLVKLLESWQFLAQRGARESYHLPSFLPKRR